MATRVTAKQRKKTGMKGKSKGKYPVATHKERMSAVKLRHNSTTATPSGVLQHVAAAARAAGDQTALDAVKAARERDKDK